MTDDDIDLEAMGPGLARVHRELLLRGPCSDPSLAVELRREAWRTVAAIDRMCGIDTDAIALELRGAPGGDA